MEGTTFTRPSNAYLLVYNTGGDYSVSRCARVFDRVLDWAFSTMTVLAADVHLAIDYILREGVSAVFLEVRKQRQKQSIKKSMIGPSSGGWPSWYLWGFPNEQKTCLNFEILVVIFVIIIYE